MNDSLGHEAGDALLVQFAQRLSRCVGAEGIAARLGGDEFAVLVDDRNGEVAPRIAASVVDALREPFALSDQAVVMSASVGIATAAPGDDAAALLRKADLAMYQAKGSGRGGASSTSAVTWSASPTSVWRRRCGCVTLWPGEMRWKSITSRSSRWMMAGWWAWRRLSAGSARLVADSRRKNSSAWLRRPE